MKTKRLLILAACLGAALFARPALAADESPAVTNAAPKESGSSWREHFTLGPDDVLSITLYGDPKSVRPEVTVGPDGKLSYLQAQEIQAAGLTVDELRAALDKELGKYFVSPRTIVVPVAYNSKKFYVLGAVVRMGVYNYTRPITVVEAIANAGGLQTGVYARNTIEMADLSRTLLVRNGERVRVDFQGLFQQGDLKQNVPLEPGDLLYFPPTSLSEVYVLGEVAAPGISPFISDTTAISAITRRGGFNSAAYKQRVLIVRGSLTKPETFIVNTADILAGKSVDFKLEPRDIVYVSKKPWARAEELLDLAATAFVQAMVVNTANAHVGPFISHPLY